MTLVVTQAAGGGMGYDGALSSLKKMTEVLGQSVIVENKARWRRKSRH